jgi:hypothetical protein
LWALNRADPEIAFPPLTLAERVVRRAPGYAATLAIERLDHAAIPLLAAVTVCAFLTVVALAPRVVGQRPRRAAASFGALAIVAVALDPVRSVSLVSLVAVAGASLLYGARTATRCRSRSSEHSSHVRCWRSATKVDRCGTSTASHAASGSRRWTG